MLILEQRAILLAQGDPTAGQGINGSEEVERVRRKSGKRDGEEFSSGKGGMWGQKLDYKLFLGRRTLSIL